MEFLRSDLVVALDDLQLGCRRAHDMHLAVAGAVGDDTLAAYLRTLSDNRARAAEWLTDILRRRHDFPHKPAEELELLRKVSVWTQSLLHGGDTAVLSQSRDEEQRLEETCVATLELPMDVALRDGLAALLADIRQQIAEINRRLAAAGNADGAA